MKFELAYCLPSGDDHLPYAYRFVTSYLQFPPACEHTMAILTDPGYESKAEELFELFSNVRIVTSPDIGKDLSRYFHLAERTDADLVMFLGGSTYCRRPGWGIRAVTAAQRMGMQNLYGACGHTGAGPVRPHIRTTGFWCSPAVLRRYPIRPKNHGERYQVEHGQGCISDWFATQGYQRWVINFGTEFDLSRANDDPHGYARGSQSNLLIGDRLTCPPYQPFA